MKFILTTFVALLVAFSVLPYPATALESFTTGTVFTTATFRWDNDNWLRLPHPKVAEFTVRDDGSAFGFTETGIPFEQFNIPNAYNIRIQRFEIQEHYHYIVDGNVAYTTTELSMHLVKAQDAV